MHCAPHVTVVQVLCHLACTLCVSCACPASPCPRPQAATASASGALTVDPATVSGIARLLAAADTQAELARLLKSRRLARLAAPYSRAKRCAEVRKTTLSQEVKSCYCDAGDAAKPWMACDALLHLELEAAADQVRPPRLWAWLLRSAAADVAAEADANGQHAGWFCSSHARVPPPLTPLPSLTPSLPLTSSPRCLPRAAGSTSSRRLPPAASCRSACPPPRFSWSESLPR